MKELTDRIKHEETVLVNMVKQGGFSDESILAQYHWVQELKEKLAKRNLIKGTPMRP